MASWASEAPQPSTATKRARGTPRPAPASLRLCDGSARGGTRSTPPTACPLAPRQNAGHVGHQRPRAPLWTSCGRPAGAGPEPCFAGRTTATVAGARDRVLVRCGTHAGPAPSSALARSALARVLIVGCHAGPGACGRRRCRRRTRPPHWRADDRVRGRALVRSQRWPRSRRQQRTRQRSGRPGDGYRVAGLVNLAADGIARAYDQSDLEPAQRRSGPILAGPQQEDRRAWPFR